MFLLLSIVLFLNSSFAYESASSEYVGKPEIVITPWKPQDGQAVTPETIAKNERWALIRAYSEAYTADSYHSSIGRINPYGVELSPYGKKYPIYNSYLRDPVHIADEMTFEKLMAIIEEKQLKTIEDVLAYLPQNMKGSNVVYMYRSRSLQGATPTAPRAIMYTPTASFVVTFNGGEPGTLGHNTLETVQYKHAEKKFEFREISFNGTDVARAGDVNPRKCLECHQSPTRQAVDPRPNWEPYSHWVGAFGSDAGRMGGTPLAVSEKKKVLPQDKEALDEQAQEFDLFKNYVDNIHFTHPRYKHMGRPNIHAPTELTEHLTIWALERAVRIASEDTEVFDLYREITNTIIRCQPSRATLEQSPAMRWHLAHQSPYYEYNTSNGEAATEASMSSASSIITQIFEPLGVDTSDWSMDFGNGGRFSFRERFGTPSNPMTRLHGAWFRNAPGANREDQRPCEDALREDLVKIDAAFAAGVQQQMQHARKAPPATGEAILERCISCHVSVRARSPLIPSFPFDQPEVLVPLLAAPYEARGTLMDEIVYRTSDMATRSEQMPPARRLSREERDALINYLKEMK